MRAILCSASILSLMALLGCQQTVSPPPFRALAGSERVSLLCREMTSGMGRDIRACPDSTEAVSDDEERHTIALVTQTWRGEVAAIDLHDRKVLDEDPFLPGTEFLPVGAIPTSIVSTPGGVASFVGVAEPGRESIFALPTSCITAPVDHDGEREPAREVTLWSACRLPSRPGEMAIVTDATPGMIGYRASCSDSNHGDAWDSEMPRINRRTDCPANLEDEEEISPIGRRKLVVTLPDEGKLVVFDAQAILNLPAGSFETCVPERVIALSTTVPSEDVAQAIPNDLREPESSDESNTPSASNRYHDLSGKIFNDSIPAGIAVADNKIYIADLAVPLIHVVDLTNPCSAFEDKPLRPLDFDVPSRPVFTSGVSISAPTIAGRGKNQRFLYALDVDGGGSAMVFDLSEGADRTPIVRPHVPELPFEAPDRIRFEAPIKRLQIISHDAPAIDPSTKLGEIGVQCDPQPGAEPPGSLYRTSSDYTKGAGPRKLRGIFGVMALGSGQVAAVDIEDWDAPCRRPMANNPDATGEDWLGCRQDAQLGQDWFLQSGEPTVSDEASCNVIEPHRMRSGRHFRTDAALGTLAPSLVAFPRLSSLESGDLATGTADEERKHPQLLAVPYVDTAALSETAADPRAVFLNVGSTQYLQAGGQRTSLDMDPATAGNNTLILPLVEPRVYPTREDFTATFEGLVVGERQSGQLPLHPEESVMRGFSGPLAANQILLRDPDAWFCDQGVEDYEMALATGREMLDESDVDFDDMLKRFATQHADFVNLKDDFVDTDPYFKTTTKLEQCGGRKGPEALKICQSWFGTTKDPKGTREFMIRASQSDDLIIEPRQEDPELWVGRVHCCFPTVHSYEIRAANQWVVRGGMLLHQMRGNGPDSSCSKDNSMRRAKLRSRAFEISVAPVCPPPDSKSGDDLPPECAPDAVKNGCVLAELPVGGVAPSQFGPGKLLPERCVFDSLKARFAIYRGQESTERDMTFRWSVTGGFSPLSTTIATSSVGLNVVPVDMVYSESLQAVVIIDGASGGVNLIGLTNFAPLGSPYL